MKRTKSVMLAAILLLSAVVVFAGTAAGEMGDKVKFDGYITTADGAGVDDADVKIQRWSSPLATWMPAGRDHHTEETGYYNTYYYVVVGTAGSRAGTYRMLVDDVEVAQKVLSEDDFEHKGNSNYCKKWSHKGLWNHQMIPEFATIAIPAVALLGLFAFYRRKQKK